MLRRLLSRRPAPPPVPVVLYTRADCPLCDAMKAELARARPALDYELAEVDIASDPELLERHGLSIPVLEIAGRPMIEHVYRRCLEARGLDRVVVLTDDERIGEAVAAFGGEWQMTPAECASGTDRIAHAATDWQATALINVQGDEPELAPLRIEGVDGLEEGFARKLLYEQGVGLPPAEVVLCRVDGRLFAVDSLCPHEGGRISDGPLQDGKHVVCPLHNYRFDPKTGEPVGVSCKKAKTFKVREKDGDAEVWV